MEKRLQILIADDQPENLLILDDLLCELYDVHTVTNGAEVLSHFDAGGKADLILMDVMMPTLDGFEACRRLKASPASQDIPIVFLTGLDSAADEEYGLSLGAEDFIHKPFSPPVVLARVRNHLALSRATRDLRYRNENLEHLVEVRTHEILVQTSELIRSKQQLIAAQSATITAFCSLAEVRDNETGNHIRRTQNYVRMLAEELRDHPRFRQALSDELIALLFKSAPLHDIGKVAIPDNVLLKPGKLDPNEWEIMQRHCAYGRDAIALSASELVNGEESFLKYALEIAYSHHERWDGNGYPQKLSGDAIPLSARLMAVADVYDALISKRVYKPAFPHEQAFDIIAVERGKQFDPDITDAFIAINEKFHQIAGAYGD
ncbi:MAG: HD domain-containing phosphohydrolase [Betaproteobacteria bacterium]